MWTCGRRMSCLQMGGRLPASAPVSVHNRETTVTSLVDAQTEAVALHRPYLYRYALSKLRRAETADEVVQDTLMAALEGQATFRGSRRCEPGSPAFSSTRSSTGSGVRRAIRSVGARRTMSTWTASTRTPPTPCSIPPAGG